MPWQRTLTVLAAPYVVWLVFAYEYHFLDGVNLAFHEAGHLFLSFGGQTLHVLGGTLGQLFFPAACAVHFLRSDRTFEAALVSVWCAESLMNVARYLGDAEARSLPLVGGHIHDWHWLLSRAGLLPACQELGFVLHALASAVAVAALVAAARIAFAAPEAPAGPAGLGEGPVGAWRRDAPPPA